MHDLELRGRALELIAAGVNDCEVGRRLGVARTTVRHWRWANERDARGARVLLALLAADSAGRAGRRGLRGVARPVPRRRPHLAHAAQRAPASLPGCEVPDHRRRLRGASAARLPGSAGSAASWLTAARRWCSGSITAISRACSRNTAPGRSTSGRIELEPWQERPGGGSAVGLRARLHPVGRMLVRQPHRALRYLSYEFRNWSTDILAIFASTCAAVGLHPRQYRDRVRLCRRADVAQLMTHVGVKS